MKKATISRRTALAGALIGSSLLVPPAACLNSEDARLLALGSRFDALVTSPESGTFTDSDMDSLDALVEEMIQTPAGTLAGLLVKAGHCTSSAICELGCC
jgi:hypothetical protein